ncbi:MAG: hypothetical protein ACYCQJ_02730 [Nitrososphaerales archaeon]
MSEWVVYKITLALKKSTKPRRRPCSYPGCSRSDIGLVMKEDGEYVPICAEHGAMIAIRRSNKKAS